MARPVVRTERLSAEERRQLHHHFGTVTHAFELLGPFLQGLTWSVFRLTAGGQLTRPQHLEMIRAALQRWLQVNKRVGTT